jgi:hypothetical protein
LPARVASWDFLLNEALALAFALGNNLPVPRAGALEHRFRFSVPRYRGVDGRKIVGFLFDSSSSSASFGSPSMGSPSAGSSSSFDITPNSSAAIASNASLRVGSAGVASPPTAVACWVIGASFLGFLLPLESGSPGVPVDGVAGRPRSCCYPVRADLEQPLLRSVICDLVGASLLRLSPVRRRA